MTIKCQIALLVIATLLSAVSPITALAGLLEVHADKGSEVTIVIIDTTAGTPTSRAAQTATDVNNDGVISFSLSPETDVTAVNITKISDGKRLNYGVTLTPGAVKIASFEPFDVPTFVDVTGPLLVTEIDLNQFLSEALTFTLGSEFSVLDGSISATTSISFFNDVGSPFNGVARVTSFDQFLQEVPEPSTVILVAVGIFAFARARYGSEKKRGQTEASRVSGACAAG